MIDLLYKGYKKISNKKYHSIYENFKDFTMLLPNTYITNLKLAECFKNVQGCVVECGTWRGGMIGGIATNFNDESREYFLFDSFEGLPEAKPIDGKAAITWQNDKESNLYFDNCKAEMTIATDAIKKSGTQKYYVTKGWFSDTLPHFDKSKKIAVLRLDGDWYDSTMQCLDNLYDCVVPGGVIIIDDYYAWEGCSKAVHDFLSKKNSNEQIAQYDNLVAYIIKNNASDL